jgi:small subunit ribosomal protein S5
MANSSNGNAKRVRSTADVELKDRLVAVQRVTKVTKGGRTFSFAAIVVVGNEKGIVGYGLGKAREVTDAVTKGIEDAKKNLIKVAIHKGTVPHEQYGKFGGSEVFIKPAAAGTGVIAGGAMRAVLESVGIKDVLAKSLGSSNPHNVVKSTMNALMQLRDARTIAAQRNIEVEKVYNG